MQPKKPHISKHKPLYTPKVTKSVILVCTTCDNRYIKTRKEQNHCLKCFIRARDLTKLKAR